MASLAATYLEFRPVSHHIEVAIWCYVTCIGNAGGNFQIRIDFALPVVGYFQIGRQIVNREVL